MYIAIYFSIQKSSRIQLPSAFSLSILMVNCIYKPYNYIWDSNQKFEIK